MQRQMLDDRPHSLSMSLMLSVCLPPSPCSPQTGDPLPDFFVTPIFDRISPDRLLVLLACLGQLSFPPFCWPGPTKWSEVYFIFIISKSPSFNFHSLKSFLCVLYHLYPTVSWCSAELAYIPNRAKISEILISKGFSPFRFEKAREGPGFRNHHLIPPSLQYGMGSLKPHFNHSRGSLEARARYFCYVFFSLEDLTDGRPIQVLDTHTEGHTRMYIQFHGSKHHGPPGWGGGCGGDAEVVRFVSGQFFFSVGGAAAATFTPGQAVTVVTALARGRLRPRTFLVDFARHPDPPQSS